MAADSSNVSPQQQHALWLKSDYIAIKCCVTVTIYCCLVARTMKPGLMTAPVSMGEEWEPIGNL